MVSGEAAAPWLDTNQHGLLARVDAIRALLERHVARRQGQEPPPAGGESDLPSLRSLEVLGQFFGLSPFERSILLLCAGIELDASLPSLCAEAQGDRSRPYATLSLALAALPEPHWSALAPSAPLRYWRLVDVGPGPSLTLSPLRIDERILHFLAGVFHVDDRLVTFLEPVEVADELVPSHLRVARRLAAAWGRPADGRPHPVVQLCGVEAEAKRSIAAAACAALGVHLYALDAGLLPLLPLELDNLVRLWTREAALGASALLLDCEGVDPADGARLQAVTMLVERAGGLLVLASRDPWRARRRRTLVLDVARPTQDEQRAIWEEALGASPASLNGQMEALVAQFDLSVGTIRSAGAEALEIRDGEGADRLDSLVWDACRVQARPRLDDLAQRIEPAAGWDELVLPQGQHETLREIVTQVRERVTVYDRWGFRSRGARGLGITALFAGTSGTGKTTAAEVLAGELRLDLYRIDLSSLVSKYIGETEKNLRRVFDAAEEGGAILLFDEADALFGKRSEVKDSHDRYANIEVSYLLQRMEAYRGLAILTTNMRKALDPAFLRRIRFVVQFPFPDAAQRAEIWRRIFPASTPTAGLDVEKLAQLNVAGGNIRNIALHAAFLAAGDGEPVRMAHLLRSAQREYDKLEKPLTGTETEGWE
ncbi:MAG: ATP-binding protein [Chloroflexi bacterium]|nr:ATP-binding protein [Chloroflexota bacterium]